MLLQRQYVNSFEQVTVNRITPFEKLGRDEGVTLPMTSDKGTTKELAKLAEKSGIKFDRKAIDEIIDTHKDLIDSVKRAAKDARSQGLKQWAMQILPTLETDLTSAQSIKETVDSLPDTQTPKGSP